MFREVARTARKLGQEETLDLLRNELRGVLSVQGDDGYPYGIPLDHYYCDEDGLIYFHSGMEGHKIDAIKRCDKVSFCVFDSGERKDGDWALTIKSAVVFGRIEIVKDRDRMVRIARELSKKFTQDEEYIRAEIEKHGERTLMFALKPEHITGKWVREA
ncbi:MAG: pyridoxamine 5'-phosphate oxidase family protein [Oscillospiraceae bacterium]|nr:pyridoxamine 5'-phosphate oxidase family protein [Oscillospiraceae bacterium]